MNMVSLLPHNQAESETVSSYRVLTANQRSVQRVVAGRTILPSILEGFKEIANASQPLKILYQAISYKPFISLFNMTGAAQQDPAIAGIGT